MKIEIACRLPGGCFLPLSSYDREVCRANPVLATGSAREPGPVWICEQTLWPAQGRLDKESQSFRHLVWKFIDKGMHFLISDILLFWHFLWHSTSAILSIIFLTFSLAFCSKHLFGISLNCMPFYLPFMISARHNITLDPLHPYNMTATTLH